jgi:hypothetical protein
VHRKNILIYRVSIKSFPHYKHLLQENYMEYKHFLLPLLRLVSKIFELSYILKKNVCIPCNFLVINVCNQRKTLCSPCISNKLQHYTVYFIWKHVWGGTITHHQEHKQLYLQHLVSVAPLLLLAAIAAGSSNGVTNTRCCRYSCLRS